MKYIYCFKYAAGGEPACGYVIGEHGTDVAGLQNDGPLVAAAVANHPGVEVGGLVIETFILAPYRGDNPQHEPCVRSHGKPHRRRGWSPEIG